MTGYRERVEGVNASAFAIRVVNFRVQTYQMDGKPGRVHGVELRGAGMRGSVADGDWVEIPVKFVHAGRGLQPTYLYNLSTGEQVRTRALKTLIPTGDTRTSIRAARILVLVLLLAAVIVVIFWFRGSRSDHAAISGPRTSPTAVPAVPRQTNGGRARDSSADNAAQGPPPLSPAAEVTVPSLLGKSVADAREELARLGLGIGRVDEQETDSVAPGQISAQDPRAGKAAFKQDSVNVTVAKAPSVIVPNVLGLGLAMASLPDIGHRAL